MGRSLRTIGLLPLVVPPLRFSAARPTFNGAVRPCPDASAFSQALTDLRSGALTDAGNARLIVPPGQTFTGAFQLPKRPGPQSGWVEVATDLTPTAISLMCPEGTRMTPSIASTLNLAKFVLPSGNGGLSVEDGASGYRISLVEGTGTGSNTGNWRTGTVSTLTDLTHQTSRIVVDRVWLHGVPGVSQTRGLQMTGRFVALINSWLQDFYDSGGDSQAVAVYGCEGPGLIENNYLDGWSEPLMFGGAHSGLVDLHGVPSDYVIRRNFITKNVSWYHTNPLYDREKNATEFKDGRRILFELNIVEHTQDADQTGAVMLLKSTNQDGLHPFAGVQDFEARGNLFRLASTGVYLAGRDGGVQSTVCNLLKRIWLHDNLFEDINSTNPYLGLGRPLQIFGQIGAITYEHNTDVRNADPSSVGLYFDGDFQALDFVRVRSNIQGYGLFGVFRSGSKYTMSTPPVSWPHSTSALDHNLFVGTGGTDPTTVHPLPGTNSLAVANDAAVGYVDYANRNYALAGGSPGKGTAHDGLDIGVTDFAAFTAGLAGVAP